MPLRHYTGLDKAHRYHFRVGGITITYIETDVVHTGDQGYTLSHPLVAGQEIELIQEWEKPNTTERIQVWVHHLEGDAGGRHCLGSLAEDVTKILFEALKRNASIGAEVLRYSHKPGNTFPEITLMIEIDEGLEEST
jgi:hypothetical protein